MNKTTNKTFRHISSEFAFGAVEIRDSSGKKRIGYLEQIGAGEFEITDSSDFSQTMQVVEGATRAQVYTMAGLILAAG